MRHLLLVGLALAGVAASASAQVQQQGAPRIVITPAPQTVVAGDSLRLHAQLIDAAGNPVSNARITFRLAGGYFEGSLDSTGLVRSGTVGTIPVAAIALVPGEKPVVQRFEVAMVAGAAARIDIAPKPARLLPGQRVHLDAAVYSAANDIRGDHVQWSSSAPGVVKVGPGGALQAVAAGKAIVTATAGAATAHLPVEVVSSQIASVEVTPATTSVRTGDVVHFKAIVKDASGKEITGLSPSWLFTPGKGIVDQDGAFVAYEPGNYQVTANFGSRSADAIVTAADRDVKRPVKVIGKLLRTAFATGELWIHPNGNVAYLTTELGGDRVYTVDISNPASPVVVDSIILNSRGVNDVMTTPDGNYMVMTREGAADRKNGIVIADSHDPLHPKQISEFTEGVTSGVHSTFIHQQAKYGTQIYLTNDGTGAVHVIDITDPVHPKQLSTWAPRQSDAGRMVHDIDVQNGLLYGAWWNDGLVILDVGNGIKGGTPSNPKFVSQYKYDLNALYKGVEKEGGKGFIRGTHTAWRYRNYVVIADEVFGNDAMATLYNWNPSRAHGRLQILDVSDIEHPKPVAWYEPEYGGVHNVWVAGDTLYVGAYNAGFHAFDLSGELRGDLKAQGREIAELMTGDPNAKLPNAPMAWGVVVNKKDGLAYVNDINSGLWALRIEPKPKPVP
ncbi:MAG: Ig-like domain-containing protein [bacterium]